MKTLNELCADVSGGLAIGPTGNSAKALTGEEFVTFAVAIPLRRDDKYDHDTDAELIAAMAAVLSHYKVRSSGDTIYWRRLPYLEVTEEAAKLRCRLLISSKPMLIDTGIVSGEVEAQ